MSSGEEISPEVEELKTELLKALQKVGSASAA